MTVTYPVETPQGRWLDPQNFQSRDGRLWVEEFDAGRRFELPLLSLRNWGRNRQPCRFNDGKPITVLTIRRPGRHRWPDAVLYLASEVERVAQGYRAAQAARPKAIPDGDDDYLVVAEIEEKCGVTRTFFNHWRAKPSRLRRGEKALRTRPEVVADGRRTRTFRLAGRLGDVRAILSGEESEHPGDGSPSVPRPGALAEATVKKLLAEALHKGPLEKSEGQRLAREKRISRRQLRRAARSLKIRFCVVGVGADRMCYWCLPGQAPPPLIHAPARNKAAEFLRAALANGAQPLQKLLKLARQKGINRAVLFQAKDALGVISERHQSAVWKLLGTAQTRPAAPETEANQQKMSASAVESPPAKRRRGRPKGTTDPQVAKRTKDMLDAWDRGEFNANKSAAGRAYGFDPADANRLINAHERGKSWD
jgi:hypothetical protein